MEQGIILAAGLGSRLREITRVTPKSLLKINGQPLLERNIEFMIEAGAKRIVLVTGYKAEQFEYLEKKYKHAVEFIRMTNEQYATSNTVSSLYCVRNYFDKDSYITTADIYLRDNPYVKYTGRTNFYILRPVASYEKPDWIATLNDQNRIVSVDQKGIYGHSYTGCSFWTKDGLAFIRSSLEKINWNNPAERNQYWDELVLPHFDTFGVYAKVLEDNAEIYEFDDMSDIMKFEKEQKGHVEWLS